MNPIPAWFHNAIVEGVQLLYSLNLRGFPAAEVAPLTTTGWIEVLWRSPVAWDEALDSSRLTAGFFSLSRQVDHWPAPKQLLDHLPPRPQLDQLPAPRPEMTQDRRAALAALRRRLADQVVVAIPRSRAVRADTPIPGGCPLAAPCGTVNPSHQVGADTTGAIDTSKGTLSCPQN